MYIIFKDKHGFTMMEFVVTIAIIGTLISVALPSYHSTNLLVREKTSIASMNLIKEAFFQYFYRMHIKGDPHFPFTPTNDDNLMDESWCTAPINEDISGITPEDLFSDGKVPTNANNNPFTYRTWQETAESTGEIRHFIEITDNDTESAAFGKSFTHSI